MLGGIVTTCADVQTRVFDGYDDDADRRHAAGCAECGALRDRIRELRGSRGAAGNGVASSAAPAGAADSIPGPLEVLARAIGATEPLGGAPAGPFAAGPGDATLPSAEKPAALPAPASLPVVDPARYEVKHVIGQGGMGIVLAAHDRRLDRPVAIKELRHDTPQLQRRFEREALVTARLQHPSIVAVHEAGRWPSGRPFYAMKHLEGRPLHEIIARATTFAERLALVPHVLAVADALAYAHGQRVIHRDLKPLNVIVGDFGETVVIDWGVAKDLGDPGEPDDAIEPAREAAHTGAAGAPARPPSSGVRATALPVTEDGTALGTPAYMPPEQAKGTAVDERVDVYAIGALLYHVLTGAAPYDSDRSLEVLLRVIAGPPTPVDSLAPDAPRDLVAIVQKAMSRAAADRYPTARELAEDLRRFLSGQLVAVHRYTSRELARRWLRRHRPAVTVAATATLALVAFGAAGLVQVFRARDTAEAARVDADLRRADAETAKGLAEADRDRAESAAIALLVEQGRRALLDGSPGPAAVLLAEAYARPKTLGPDDGPLRLLLARAMRSVEARWRLDDVTAMSLSPDGERLAIGRKDGSAALLDPRRGKVILEMMAAGAVIGAVRWSADGRLIALGRDDGAIDVFDSVDGSVRRLNMVDRPKMLAFDHEARLLAAVGRGTPVSVFDVSRAELLHELGTSADGYASVAFLGHTPRIVAVSRHDAAVWDVERAKRLAAIAVRPTTMAYSPLAVSPDGARFAIATEAREIVVYDGRTFERRGSVYHELASVASAFSADGERLVSTGDITIRTWDVETLIPRERLVGHGSLSYTATFGPTSDRLYTTGADGTFRVWSEEDGVLLATYLEGTEVLRGLVVADGGRTVVTHGESMIEGWDTSGTRTSALVRTGARHLSADGERVIVAEATSVSTILDTIGGAWLGSLPPMGPGAEILAASATHVVVTEDGRHAVICVVGAPASGPTFVLSPAEKRVEGAIGGGRLVVAATGGAELRDLASGALVAKLGAGEPTALAISPDGSRVLTGDSRGNVTLWDGAGVRLASLSRHIGDISSLSFDASGALALSVGGDAAKISDAATGALRATLAEVSTSIRPSRDARVVAAVLSADGRRVVTDGGDRILRVWDAATGAFISAAAREGAAALKASNLGDAIAVSPEGDLLASESTLEKTVRIWAAATGQLVAVISLTTHVKSIAFTAGGTRLVILGHDGEVETWDLPRETRDPRELATVLATRAGWHLVEGRLLPRAAKGVPLIVSAPEQH